MSLKDEGGGANLVARLVLSGEGRGLRPVRRHLPSEQATPFERGLPREQKMLKGHLPRDIYHRVHSNIRR